jgi:hypothetical protein
MTQKAKKIKKMLALGRSSSKQQTAIGFEQTITN